MSRPCIDMKRQQKRILDNIYAMLNRGWHGQARKIVEQRLRPFHVQMRDNGCPEDSIVDFDLETWGK